MPITLYYMNVLFKNKRGLAFGILASMLFIGYLLGLIYFNNILIKILIVLFNVISIIIIVYIERYFKIGKKENDRNIV